MTERTLAPPMLAAGYRFADGAEVIDCHQHHGWCWRALVHWPFDEETGTARVHPWQVCLIEWTDATGWVRFSSEVWAHDRTEAQDLYLEALR